MLFVLTLILAVLFLPWPWNLAAITCAAAVESVLAIGGVRYARRDLSTVGVQTMLGGEAEAISPLNPGGQVKVDGVIWQARAGDGETIGAGETVRVRAIDGLTLEVERATPP